MSRTLYWGGPGRGGGERASLLTILIEAATPRYNHDHHHHKRRHHHHHHHRHHQNNSYFVGERMTTSLFCLFSIFCLTRPPWGLSTTAMILLILIITAVIIPPLTVDEAGRGGAPSLLFARGFLPRRFCSVTSFPAWRVFQVRR